MDTAIRTAVVGDCEALTALALRSKAYWGYSAEFMAACRGELTIDAEFLCLHEVFVLTQGSRSLGFYSLQKLSASRVDLGHLFVEPDHIGRCHGRRLWDHACARAGARGFGVLVIHSDPDAEPFYLSRGARRVGSTPSGSIPGRELPLMEFDLSAVRQESR